MSDTLTTTAPTPSHAPSSHDHDGGHDDHGHHDPNLAHHFETMEQQIRSAKLGMWVFLATEILMFGGLFAAYAIWRRYYTVQFDIGHVYLSTTLGGINTAVLILSSFTMAWAVRTAMLGKTKATSILLALTFMGGVGFMVIKSIEYSGKFSHGMGPGAAYYHAPEEALEKLEAAGWTPEQIAAAGEKTLDPAARYDVKFPEGYYFKHTPAQLKAAQGFFSIYYAMTGLHGLHVLIGMGLIAWIFVRNLRGAFSPAYNFPVDLVGLYWHLVDLIWIFLFPLLYLIH